MKRPPNQAAGFVIPAQFHWLKELLSGALTVTPEQIAEAVSFLALTKKLIAEGAGAAALAAARQYSDVYGALLRALGSARE